MSKKTGFIAFAIVTLAGAFGIGCGGSACEDYETKVNECCAKAPEGTTCSIKVDENADDDACQAAIDQFKCPF